VVDIQFSDGASVTVQFSGAVLVRGIRSAIALANELRKGLKRWQVRSEMNDKKWLHQHGRLDFPALSCHVSIHEHTCPPFRFGDHHRP
ncbi:MAG: hypothetical protein ABGX10_16840, partial [Paracoccus sp. (in: a-proteobacteria)]|uniref:hypothetical protein n=1 Tax=Paracoccus sp. TaxID=267 RepID=UPI0032428E7C